MIKNELVLDTNVLISATLWDNSVSHKLLIKLIEKDIELFTTLEIIKEYKNAVIRDFQYSEEKVDEIIEKLLSFMKLIKTSSNIEIIKDDPDDNKILECAKDSGSEYILIYDNHLLKINEFENIKILRPDEFVINYD